NGVRVGGFYAYAPSFGGGVRVASGNLLGGNNIATAPGPGGGPDVELYKGNGSRLGGYYAYPPGFAGGVYVGVGNLNGSGDDQIVTGPGKGGGPHVQVFDAAGNVKASFMLTGDGNSYGVRPSSGKWTSAPGDLFVSQGRGSLPLVRFRHTDGSIFFPS